MLKLEHDTILSDQHLRILKAVLLHQIHYYKLNSNKKMWRQFYWGSGLSIYEIKLWNRVTQNGVTLRATNSEIFIVLLSSYYFGFIKN